MTTCLGNCCSPGCRLWCLWWCLFVLSFFPRGVLDEILNLIESVSEDFPSYSWISVFDIGGQDQVQRRVGWVREGGGGVGWWNIWCKCCNGLELLTCTEIWLFHITLLLSAESEAKTWNISINTTDFKWNCYCIIVITFIYLYNNISWCPNTIALPFSHPM